MRMGIPSAWWARGQYTGDLLVADGDSTICLVVATPHGGLRRVRGHQGTPSNVAAAKHNFARFTMNFFLDLK